MYVLSHEVTLSLTTNMARQQLTSLILQQYETSQCNTKHCDTTYRTTTRQKNKKISSFKELSIYYVWEQYILVWIPATWSIEPISNREKIYPCFCPAITLVANAGNAQLSK